MANTKEIQDRIKSINDTLKITNAMYMISSSKLKKSKKMLSDTEPYFFTLQSEMSRILRHIPDISSIYFKTNEDKDAADKKVGYIVITADKGLAGSYNHNVLKEAKRLCDEAEQYKIFAIGETGRAYFSSLGYNVENSFRFSANNPSVHRARVITEDIVERYKKEEMDEVYIVYTKMEHGMKEEVQVEQLLPLKTNEFIKEELAANARQGKSNGTLEDFEGNDDYFVIYPSPKVVLNDLTYNYVTGFVYGALVEGFATEENARMVAMQAATDNAEAMLKELSIEYNRVRQAAITQEITEVIGGAKALKKKKMKKKAQAG